MNETVKKSISPDQWLQNRLRRTGRGSPVVLIHGIPTSNLLWRKVMPEPAKTHQVFAPDMLNYGKSDKPADANVSIEAQSRLIVKFMDKLGIKSADIVAHADK